MQVHFPIILLHVFTLKAKKQVEGKRKITFHVHFFSFFSCFV